MPSNATKTFIDSMSTPEPLLQFLQGTAFGLLRVSLDGAIQTINPAAASLLAPLLSGRPENLFVALADAAPQLRRQVEQFEPVTGRVGEAINVPLAARGTAGEPRILAIGIFKLDAASLLVTVSEGVSPQRAARIEAQRARSGMEGELRQAIAENKLFLQYQPVVGLRHEATGAGAALDRSAGVETFVRWNHRIRGAVPPLEFISMAEGCGLTAALSRFVLVTACSQFVQWREQIGPLAPRLLAINLSRGELMELGFVASVQAVLESHAMEPGQLQLEVHEGIMVDDSAVHARLKELKEIGVRLALNNFGVGRSSLVSLHQLPMDVVKIDRSLVTEAVTSEHHRVLIEAIIMVARSLGMSVVAEGIETEAQLAVVREIGCKQGQGYFFSGAISAAKVVQWLTE